MGTSIRKNINPTGSVMGWNFITFVSVLHMGLTICFIIYAIENYFSIEIIPIYNDYLHLTNRILKTSMDKIYSHRLFFLRFGGSAPVLVLPEKKQTSKFVRNGQLTMCI